MTKHNITMMASALALALGSIAVQANEPQANQANTEKQKTTTSSVTSTTTSNANKQDNHGQMVSSTARQNNKNMKPEFSTIDTDSDGYIVVADLDADSPLKSSFATYDIDRDNRLSRTEYQSWIRVAGTISSKTQQFSSIDEDNDGFVVVTDLDANSPLITTFTTYDLDKDNRLSRTEYDAWIASVDIDSDMDATASTTTHGSTVSQVARTRGDFKQLDTDKDGKLSDAEWALASVDVEMSTYDADGDGALSESEYRDLSLASVDSEFDSEFESDMDTDLDTDIDTDIDTDDGLDDSGEEQ